jgi:tetratricopeptide (TPR) repeat protein
MRRTVFLFFVLALIISSFNSIHAQTPDAAINLFKNALKKTEKGDLDGAMEDYSRAIVLSSQLRTREPQARIAGQSFASTDAVNIVDDSSDIRVIDPFTANAYNNRGLLRYRKGDYQGALADYNAALNIRPGLAAAYVNRAAALVATGEKSSALKDLDRALALKKDFFQAYSNRGSLNHDLGHDKEALADLNRAVELNNRVGDTFYHRGYANLALNNLDESLKDFTRAIELKFPQIAWAYQGRGTTLMKKGLMQDAITDFNTALELNSEIIWAYFNRGLAKVYLGNEAEAQGDFETVLKMRPDLQEQLKQKVQLARFLRVAPKE